MRAFQTLFALSFLAFALTACGSGAYTPETVFTALNNDPSGVVGKFRMTVRRVGWYNDTLFLMSDPNYRAPHILIVMVRGDTVRDILQGKNQTVQQYFLNREIQVSGLARRRRVVSKDSAGNLTGPSYYQTRIFVGNAEDFEVSHE
ncbi:hypothetical protein A0J51_02393 [Gluconobacter japonicus]|nr:hypothetical protein A0J51_02393 [Gluconobacter japonicus]